MNFKQAQDKLMKNPEYRKAWIEEKLKEIISGETYKGSTDKGFVEEAVEQVKSLFITEMERIIGADEEATGAINEWAKDPEFREELLTIQKSRNQLRAELREKLENLRSGEGGSNG